MHTIVSTSHGHFGLDRMTENLWNLAVPWQTDYKQYASLYGRALLKADGSIEIIHWNNREIGPWETAPFDVYDYGDLRVISRRMAEPDGSEQQFTGPIDFPFDPKLFIDLPESSEERYPKKWPGKFLDQTPLPVASEDRKKVPLASIFDFFPLAMVELAKCIYVGNEKHNQGNPIQWQREKSDDHSDCLLRHFMERGYTDTDGIQHSAKVAWRALAILQLELERCADKKL